MARYFYNQMISKIILAALCLTTVSSAPGIEPIKVVPGCANLWVSP
jgi:hypothetical protein